MTGIKNFKTRVKVFSLIALALFFFSCENDFSLSELNITKIDYSEDFVTKLLNIPSGTFVSVPSNFDHNNSNTWTGNVAQYVQEIYSHEINYTVKNNGGNKAFNVELDLYIIYDNGEQEVKTIKMGEISGNSTKSGTLSSRFNSRRISDVSGEVFWSD